MYQSESMLIRLLGGRSVTNKQHSLSFRSSKYLCNQIAQRILKYTSLSLSPLPCRMTEFPAKLISFLFSLATFPMLPITTYFHPPYYETIILNQYSQDTVPLFNNRNAVAKTL